MSRPGAGLPPATRSPATEVAGRATFDEVRYAQCWEDADVLVEALDPRPGEVCLSIGSAGDNSLALLTRQPARVIAVDLSPAQLACLELRIAAYRRLDHGEVLELYGSRPSGRRATLYRACRDAIPSPRVQTFWDARIDRLAAHGLGGVGRFEGYFRLFRRWVLPLVHGRGRVAALLQSRPPVERRAFHDRVWDSPRWRLLFRLFFSRLVMGRLGRDPAFFAYALDDLATHLRRRVEHALVALDPADNPYLHWILTGTHGAALPLALRPEHGETIRAGLDRLEWHEAAVESYLAGREGPAPRIHRWNLSDIFEYMSAENAAALLARIAAAGAPGGRVVYWNMLVPRSRPDSLADRLVPLDAVAAALHARDRAFFYRRLVIEELR